MAESACFIREHARVDGIRLAFKFANLTQIEYPCDANKRNVTVLTGDKHAMKRMLENKVQLLDVSFVSKWYLTSHKVNLI